MSDTYKYNEDAYEQTLIALLRDELGYRYEYGPDVERDPRDPWHPDMRGELARINPDIPAEFVAEAYRQLTNLTDGSLIQRNEQFMDWLQNGLPVTLTQKGETKSYLVRLIDYGAPQKNTFRVVNQWRVEDLENNRLADYEPYFEKWSAEEMANTGYTMCCQIDVMMNGYLTMLEERFRTEGGMKERMYRVRTGYREAQDRKLKEMEATIKWQAQRIAELEEEVKRMREERGERKRRRGLKRTQEDARGGEENRMREDEDLL